MVPNNTINYLGCDNINYKNYLDFRKWSMYIACLRKNSRIN